MMRALEPIAANRVAYETTEARQAGARELAELENFFESP